MDYLAVVASEGARISEVARRGPLEGLVPHMKRWTMGDVVVHLGGVHRWAASIVAGRTYDGRGHRRGEATGDGLLRWFDEGVELLVSTVKTADPDEECGNFSPGSPNRSSSGGGDRRTRPRCIAGTSNRRSDNGARSTPTSPPTESTDSSTPSPAPGESRFSPVPFASSPRTAVRPGA